MINDKDFIMTDLSEDSLNGIFNEKQLKMQIENQKNTNWNLFLNRTYNITVFGLFSFVALTSTYLFLQIINEL